MLIEFDATTALVMCEHVGHYCEVEDVDDVVSELRAAGTWIAELLLEDASNEDVDRFVRFLRGDS